MALHSACKRFCALLALVLFFAAPALRADTQWNWSYNSSVYYGAGTFTTTTTASPVTVDGTTFDAYTITDITGSLKDGGAITGLLNFSGSDNLLSLTDPQLDFLGFSFATSTDSWNIYFDNGTFTAFGDTSPSDNGNGHFSASIISTTGTSPVPEPSSVMLLGTAMMALGGFAWYRKQNSAAITATAA